MFSFSGSHWELVLKSINKILPATVKAVAVFYCNESKSVTAKYAEPQNSNNIFELDIKASVKHVSALRSNKSDCWLQKNELPFEMESQQETGLSMFSENERNILLLSFHNQYDNLNDLLYIYLPSGERVFGINTKNKVLTQDNKHIISLLTKNIIKYILDTSASDALVYEQVVSGIGRITETLKQKDIESDKEQRRWVEYALQIIENDEISKKGAVFAFSSDSVTKISQFNDKIELFKDFILSAAGNALMLSDFKKIRNITIEPYHFIKEEKNIRIPSKTDANVEGQYQKAYMLLEKYEEAAEMAIKNRTKEFRDKPLTGTEIGSYIGTGISAAAISDAIGKQRSQISKLLLRNDLSDKWPLLRKLFKPILNTLTPKETLREKIA